MLFRMVPKRVCPTEKKKYCFRAVLFRMVPKHKCVEKVNYNCFRAVLFRMVPKLVATTS